jgi:hypothetical protein
MISGAVLFAIEDAVVVPSRDFGIGDETGQLPNMWRVFLTSIHLLPHKIAYESRHADATLGSRRLQEFMLIFGE